MMLCMVNELSYELILRGLANYYGMTIQQLYHVIDNDPEKLQRFIKDYFSNHN